MKKITFENATLVSEAKVTIEGVNHLVTEAEYSGGTDLNAETFNQLQDNIEEAIEETNTYSEEEVVVGTFLGKPLYRKVLTGTISSSTTAISLEHKNLISIKGEIIGNNGGTNSISYYYSSDNYSYVYSHSYSEVRILASSSNHNKEYYIIVEYTKTTD